MNWISDWALPKIQGLFKREAPENLWHNCPSCQQMIFHRDLERALRVCTHCGHHMRLGAVQRLEATLDPGFSRIELPKAPADPLRFRDQRRYADRLRESQAKVGMDDAVAVAHLAVPNLLALVHAAVDVELGDLARGRTITDWYGDRLKQRGRTPDVDVAVGVDADAFDRVLVDAILSFK